MIGTPFRMRLGSEQISKKILFTESEKKKMRRKSFCRIHSKGSLLLMLTRFGDKIYHNSEKGRKKGGLQSWP